MPEAAPPVMPAAFRPRIIAASNVPAKPGAAGTAAASEASTTIEHPVQRGERDADRLRDHHEVEPLQRPDRDRERHQRDARTGARTAAGSRATGRILAAKRSKRPAAPQVDVDGQGDEAEHDRRRRSAPPCRAPRASRPGRTRAPRTSPPARPRRAGARRRPSRGSRAGATSSARRGCAILSTSPPRAGQHVVAHVGDRGQPERVGALMVDVGEDHDPVPAVAAQRERDEAHQQRERPARRTPARCPGARGAGWWTIQ